MRGDAVGQAEVLGQPVALGVAVALDGEPGLGPRDDGAEGDADDVQQFVLTPLLAAGIAQGGEVV